ncbi:Subtilase family protein [Noviherbaspirillum suwonense]|uniref:Subtilase family protein n=2 Tax=Noviherbaspirillum suwonense TaxID=1224511 RepID=A0ABY1PZN5_9BURK|nr:Subtilase family protein [Noviherbaspirillum suwonense]
MFSGPSFSLPSETQFFKGNVGQVLISAASPLLADDRIAVETKMIPRSKLGILARDPGVLAIAPDMPMKLLRPLTKAQIKRFTASIESPGKVLSARKHDFFEWGIEATGAGTSKYTGQGITVAVLDSGIDAKHEDFKGIDIIENDFTGEGNGDTDGHGTHCAGIIFGRAHEGSRISVAPGVQTALIAKVIGKDGASSENVLNAMYWAAERGATIICMSVGFDFPALALELERNGLPKQIAFSRALEAYRANINLFDKMAAFIKARAGLGNPTIIVASAGNESERQIDSNFEVAVSPPAAAESVISVGAFMPIYTEGRRRYAVAPFSNTGPNICAPGFDIVSSKLGGGRHKLSGTSMAAPHVAGIGALWAEKLKTEGMFNGLLLTSKIIGSATTTDLVQGFDVFDVGAGMVKAP